MKLAEVLVTREGDIRMVIADGAAVASSRNAFDGDDAGAAW
jgi:hypothetical protein